jgi:segregation and condensation protein B
MIDIPPSAESQTELEPEGAPSALASAPPAPEDAAPEDAAPEDAAQALRLIEAILFAAAEPLDRKTIAARLPGVENLDELLETLQAAYAGRGVTLVRREDRWAFRTAEDLAAKLTIERTVPRKLSRAGAETLAVIAYYQPVTRTEIENIRGVASAKGTFDVLIEAGWIKPGGRREVPGRPLTWVTTHAFLDHFGLSAIGDLPAIQELEASGLLDRRPAVQAAPQLAQGEADDERPPDEADDIDEGDHIDDAEKVAGVDEDPGLADPAREPEARGSAAAPGRAAAETEASEDER